MSEGERMIGRSNGKGKEQRERATEGATEGATGKERRRISNQDGVTGRSDWDRARGKAR